MKKTILTTVALGCFVMVSTQAHALLLTPGNADWFGNEGPGVPAIFAAWNTQIANDGGTLVVSDDTELYKMDVGASSDVGSFDGSYQTTFTNTPGDPSDALINYISGASISTSTTYLLVKDGNQNPDWYGFDITGWNGTEDIVMNSFWPNQGAISHVSIYGEGITSTPGDPGTAPIPEPATMLLFGTGMLVLTGTKMRKKKATK